jgi:hypothetical protein
MKKIALFLVLGMAVTFANAQDKKTTTTTTKTTTTTAVQNNKTTMKVAELQKAITDNILKTYPGYKTLEAYKLDNSGADAFEVVIEKATSKLDLFYDKDGKFLKKEVPVKAKPVTTTDKPQQNPKK